jgi:hypothetical protein
MMRYLRAVSIPAAIVLQFCAAVAAPQVGRPTEAVAKPSPQPSSDARHHGHECGARSVIKLAHIMEMLSRNDKRVAWVELP